MSFNGVRLFRYALIFEMSANMIGIIPLLFAPETALSLLVKGPNQITPATKSLMQWHVPTFLTDPEFGVIFLTAFTLPLALCYPNPAPSRSKTGGGDQIVAWRRLTYILFGAGEAGLGTMMMIQWMQGDSGLTDVALLGGAATMGAFLGLRGFFLYARPSWMEGPANARKAL
ncbi:hypothetical protein LTR53_007294 [Teratosphaeriaceae sp. CCFEE 6253]|nr:hypothetical protein LTR53_007294 [Teratosphaeriaceae sp. CCFEE 6253]